MNDRAPQSALALLKTFLYADLTERNAEKSLAFLSPDVWWFGTGDGEDVRGLDEAARYFRSEIASDPEPYALEFLACCDQSQPDGSGAAHLKCRVTGRGATLLCRCSAAVRRENGALKIYAIHMSVPDAIQQSGEFFPFALAEQYERELHEEFLNDTVEGGVLGRFVGPGAEIYIVNRQMLDLLGYPSEEIFRKELSNCADNAVYPDDRASCAAQIRDQLTQQHRYHVEYRMLRRDGSVIWVESHGKQIADRDGRPALVGIVNDITARKNAELLAKTQYQEIRNLYDTIPGGVFICKFNPDWDVTFANRGFYDFLGYSRQEFSALFHDKMTGVIYPEDQAIMTPAIKAQLLHGNYVENTNRLVCKGGIVKWISIHAVLNTGEDGDPCFYCTFVDITPQKEAERKLRESEQRYRIAIEGAGVNVWEYDIQNHCVTLPDGIRRAFSCDEKEPFSDALSKKAGITPAQQKEVADLFRRIEAGEPRVSGDFWVDSPTTHARWCERVTYSVVFDEDGRPVKAYGASIDITQSKLAEKRYQEELTYRDSVAESVTASCCVNLTAGKVELMRTGGQSGVPAGFETAVDYRRRTRSFLYDNEMSDEQNERLSPPALLRSYNEGITVLSEEYLARSAQDRYCWMRVDVNLMKHPESGDVLAFFYNRDLTNDLIRLSVLDTVLTKNYEEVGIVDLRTGAYKRTAGDGSFMPASAECNYAENIGRFCAHRVAEADRRRMREILQLDFLTAKIEAQSVFDVQFLGLDSQKNSRFYIMRFQFLRGNPDVMLITRQNVDELVRKEQKKQQELEQAVAEAKKANEVKSEFLSRMSHEIRTPLNAIIGLAELGRENLSQPHPSEKDGLDYVLKTLDSSHYLLSLINDILDMSKIESGQIALVREEIDFPRILGSIRTIIGTQAEAKKIRFTVDPCDCVPRYLLGDATRMEQVLINLLNNAVKFTPSGGTVSLSMEAPAKSDTSITLRFTVSDTGVGISPEFLPRIFDPFAQEYAGITSAYGGSGLGLSIARRLTRLMDGDLTVQSTKDVGSVFTAVMRFDLPNGEDADRSAALPSDAASNLQGMHILLCEDHPLNTMVVRRLLERRGCTVDCAENGRQGVECFSRSAPNTYDAILMDIRMPVMDGLSAARAIRALERPDAKRVPILAMTANAYDEDIQLSRQAGMNAHLSKPIEPDILFRTLSDLRRPQD